MNFSEAKQVAEAWVHASTSGEAVIYREKTLSLSYGWVFFYNSLEFIADPSDISSSFVGNAPILIDRTNGELRVLGPRYSERLKQIEAELPPACLLMSPEQPKW